MSRIDYGPERALQETRQKIGTRRNFLRTGGLMFAVAGLSSNMACGRSGGSGSEGDSKQAVSYGVIRSPDGVLPKVVADQGYFENAGLDVQFYNFAEGGGPKLVEAMAGGTPEMGMVSLATTIFAVGQGTADFQVVSLTIGPVIPTPLIAKKSIKSVRDLEGKTITTPKGGGQYYKLARLLTKFDMSFNDIDYKPMSIGRAQAAFLAGHVDALISSVNGSVLIKNNMSDGHVLFAMDEFDESPGDKIPLVSLGAIVANRDVINSKPEAVASFIKAYNGKGIKLVTSPEKFDETLPEVQSYLEEMGAGQKDVGGTKTILKSYDWYSVKRARSMMNGNQLTAAIRRQGDFWKKKGALKSAPKPSAVVNNSIIESIKLSG